MTKRYATGWSDPRGVWTTVDGPDSTPDAVARYMIAKKVKEPSARRVYLIQIFESDMHLAAPGVIHMYKATSNDDNTYRISIFPDGVDVICLGLESVDSCLEGHRSEEHTLNSSHT